jgi:hypothetical protein
MPTLANINGRSLTADVGGRLQQGLAFGENLAASQQNRQIKSDEMERQKQIELLRGKMIPGTTGYDPNAANDLRKIDPKAADDLLTSMGIDDEMKREEAARFAYRLEQTPFHLRAPLIEERVREIDARYGNETHSSDTRELLAADEQTQNRMIKGFQQAALTAKQRADVNKTNQGLASAKTEILDGGAVIQALPDGSVTVRDPAGNIVKGQARLDVLAQSRTQEINHKAAVEGAKEASKLGAQYKLEPQVKEAVAIALENVKIQSEVASEDRSNEKALGVYEVATKGLTDALSGATTGPGMEYLPALTANQQVAKGAVAAMAPVLKQLFRGAGEGTFTDKDQALLLDMIPTRNDHAETRAAKLANIDAIVRAKLGTSGPQKPLQPVSVGRFSVEVE